MNKYYTFTDSKSPELIEVGGKAKSLMTMIKGGFNVPNGSVLTVSYFEEWINTLKGLEIFDKLSQNNMDYKLVCKTLKEEARKMVFSENQKQIVNHILQEHGKDKLYAVRSSSPEEDLSGASFAGGYETFLGVTERSVFDAIKNAFISCLDERVFFYKEQNGFSVTEIRIAVIIQLQINSAVSGVGFSINPLNNDYDEVVINSNVGLGESVVAGMVTPDEFIVNKVSAKICSERIGTKEKQIVLDSVHGTKIIEGIKMKMSLSHSEVRLLSLLICEVEQYYGFPVDIEWAIAEGKIYLLQSRPITTHIVIPKLMMTSANAPRQLYLDASLVKQGISNPISVIGCDCIKRTQRQMFKSMMGKDVMDDPIHGMAATEQGRMYLNLSTSIKMQGKKRVVDSWNMVDNLTAEMIEKNDLDAYVPQKLVGEMRGALLGAILKNLGALKLTMRANKNPDAYKTWYQPFENDLDEYLLDIVATEMSLSKSVDDITSAYLSVLNKMLPMTYAAEMARSKMKKIVSKVNESLLDELQYMERSLPDNITIEMGFALYDLSRAAEIRSNSYEVFRKKLELKQTSEEFNDLWTNYIKRFGCRTSQELDVGVKRPYEDIEMLFKQMKTMSKVEEASSPRRIFEDSKIKRERAYAKIFSLLPKNKQKQLSKTYKVLTTLGGKREALKYWYIRSLDTIRQLVLKKAKILLEQDKMDELEDLYWLSIEEIDQALVASAQSVKELIARNKKQYEAIEHIKTFPKIIDSRGRILGFEQPEPEDGVIAGQPISPGKVVGRIKVLNTPDEKELLPGEIMVTRATDPGWTPLFINAGAILLEVGGLLQHGALVAREYGKPCVAGIVDIVDKLEDGQLVEVDGSKGTIRFLEE